MTHPEPNPSEPQLRAHVFDGIQEYDQKLPNWWLFTLYIAIAWFVIHWLAYYQFNIGEDGLRSAWTTPCAAIESAAACGSSSRSTTRSSGQWRRDPKIVEAGSASLHDARCVACHGTDLMRQESHPENPTLPGLPLDGQGMEVRRQSHRRPQDRAQGFARRHQGHARLGARARPDADASRSSPSS